MIDTATMIIQIKELLKQTYFTKVVWQGEVWMMGTENRPAVFIGYDADFYDAENNTWDSPREYLKDTPVRIIMDQVVKIFVDNKIEEGFEISI